LITIFEDEPVKKVQDLFNKHKIHHLPVIDRKGQLTGIVSKQDLMRVAMNMRKGSSNGNEMIDFQSIVVEEMMTPDPIFIEPEDTLGLAADIFLANEFHSLPIVEGDQLVGIITTHDLLRFAFDLAHSFEDE
jgi:acetoin utilization protein AcuB